VTSRLTATTLAALLASVLATPVAAERPTVRMLADFDDVRGPGALGSHNAVQRAPSTVALQRVPEAAGQALAVSGTSAPGGMAGVWLAFYDIGATRKQFVDASRLDFLTFRIRGVRPPRLIVKVADGSWAAKGDGFEIGELTRLLPQDVGAAWQQVTIPLGGLPLDRKALAALMLVVDSPGEFSFVVDDVALKRDPEDALPQRSVVAPRGVP